MNGSTKYHKINIMAEIRGKSRKLSLSSITLLNNYCYIQEDRLFEFILIFEFSWCNNLLPLLTSECKSETRQEAKCPPARCFSFSNNTFVSQWECEVKPFAAAFRDSSFSALNIHIKHQQVTKVLYVTENNTFFTNSAKKQSKWMCESSFFIQTCQIYLHFRSWVCICWSLVLTLLFWTRPVSQV